MFQASFMYGSGPVMNPYPTILRTISMVYKIRNVDSNLAKIGFGLSLEAVSSKIIVTLLDMMISKQMLSKLLVLMIELQTVLIIN
jgi:hypothetical protein